MARQKVIGDSPLSPADYADIQRALERLNTHRIRAEEAKQAGENVDDDIALNEAYRERFAAYKRVYFPNKP